MKDLLDAGIYVDTVFSTESGAGSGNWFTLADYATMHELLTDCAGWFPDEEEPEYVYTECSDIPDFLINRNEQCPNIFEIRDAIQMLDGLSIGLFAAWCRSNGHDLTTDDPLLLVTRYLEHVCPACEPCTDNVEPDGDTGACITYGLGIGPVEIFDDSYN